MVGPCGVVGLADGFELPPQAASARASEMATGTNKRMRTTRAYRFASRDAGREAYRSGHGPGDSVRRVRRLANLALAAAVATGATLALTVAPASAHICPLPAEIPVGQPATINVGVTVEAKAVPDVEISVPVGLPLDRVDPKAGWTFTRAGSSVRYRGGPIPAYTCKYFSLGVTAPTRGAFGISVVQRAADGKIVARSTPDPNNASDRALGQIVYAGVKPPAAASGSKSPSAATIASVALVGIGAVMAGVLALRAWRARGRDEGDQDERDAELRARVERFKKRTPDPPAPE